MENFWCAARLMPKAEARATHFLGLAGFEVYLPRLRESRVVRGRKVALQPPLFPGYCFVLIVSLQFYSARWCPGVIDLIRDGAAPAKVPDHIIADIRGREHDGLVELPKAPGLQRGDKVRITSGPFEHHLALYQGQAAHDRVEVLLAFLGSRQRTELPASAIEVAS